MRKWILWSWIILFGGLSLTAAEAQLVQVDLKPRVVLEKKRYKPGANVQGKLVLDIPEPYHVHANPASEEFYIATTLEFKANKNFKVQAIRYPKGKEYTFDFAPEKPLLVYEGQTVIPFTLNLDKKAPLGNLNIAGSVRYQACDDKACYAPQTKEVKAALTVAKDAAEKEVNEEFMALGGEDSPPAGELVPAVTGGSVGGMDFAGWVKYHFEQGNWFLFVGIIFVGGLLLNLTPCVFPIIPITLGFFGMQAKGNVTKRIGLTATYALSIAITYAVLGTVASLAGKAFGFQFQNPYFVWALVGIITVLSLAMFGVYKLQVPPSLMRYVGARQGAMGAVMMGMLAGVAAAPCIGPVVAALIPIVATLKSPAIGFFLFLALGLGLGAPYFVLGLFYDRLQGKMPRSGEWTILVERIFGVLLIAVALYFAKSVLPSSIYGWLWVAFFVSFALYFFLADRKEIVQPRVIRLKQVAGLLLIVLALRSGYAMLQPHEGIQWTNYTTDLYEQAIKDGKPVLIDFTATWCIACGELEEKTYTDPDVIRESERFVRLVLDSTKETDETKAIHAKHEVVGLPTVIFIGSDGKERRELRLTGFEAADGFLARLKQVR